MKHLICNNRGETLVEVMASILIAALSVALLFTCVMASSEMEKMTQKTDEKHYNALSGADARQDKATKTGDTPYVTITRTEPGSATATPGIEIYGDTAEGLYSYAYKEATTP